MKSGHLYVQECRSEFPADEATIDRWLREVVVPTIKAHEADPARVLTAEEFQRGLHVHIDSLTWVAG
jgi:hypothetical protein